MCASVRSSSFILALSLPLIWYYPSLRFFLTACLSCLLRESFPIVCNPSLPISFRYSALVALIREFATYKDDVRFFIKWVNELHTKGIWDVNRHRIVSSVLFFPIFDVILRISWLFFLKFAFSHLVFIFFENLAKKNNSRVSSLLLVRERFAQNIVILLVDCIDHNIEMFTIAYSIGLFTTLQSSTRRIRWNNFHPMILLYAIKSNETRSKNYLSTWNDLHYGEKYKDVAFPLMMDRRRRKIYSKSNIVIYAVSTGELLFLEHEFICGFSITMNWKKILGRGSSKIDLRG